MNSRNNNTSIAEETIILHKGHIGRVNELSNIALEEVISLLQVELNEKSKKYQEYLGSINGTPEGKL